MWQPWLLRPDLGEDNVFARTRTDDGRMVKDRAEFGQKHSSAAHVRSVIRSNQAEIAYKGPKGRSEKGRRGGGKNAETLLKASLVFALMPTNA